MTNVHCVFRGDTEYVVFNPEGGGGRVLPYMGYIGMCRWFSSSLLKDSVYKSEPLGLE